MASEVATQLHIRQEGSRDDDAVAEIVDAVAHQHGQVAAAPGLLGIEVVVMVVPVTLVVVDVAVQLHLLQQPEEQQAAEQRRKQRLRVRQRDSKASGSTFSSEVPSRMPADRLTRLLTRRDSTPRSSSPPPALKASRPRRSRARCRSAASNELLNQARQRAQASSAAALR